MTERQSCSGSSRPSSSVTPRVGVVSPLKKPPAWEPLGLYGSPQKVASEQSRHTSNPNSPRSSIESFPKLVREVTSPTGSPARTSRAHPALSYAETDGSNPLLGHLCLLFCNVLPSVLLSILCITLTETANLLQRIVNYLQTPGKPTETNMSKSHTSDSPSSSTPNFHRTFSPRTPSVSTSKSEMCNDRIRGKIGRTSNIKNHSEVVRSHEESLRHLLEELATALTNSQNPSEVEQALARHVIASEHVIQRREQLHPLPIPPTAIPPVDDLGQPPPNVCFDETKPPASNQIVTQANEADDDDCGSLSSSSSAAMSTKCTEENPASSRHRDVTYETMDEAALPSLDFMSPLALPLASSPATEKTEPLSRIESPLALPPPLSVCQSLAVEHGEEEKESESDRDTVDRDSLIGARRVLSTSERSAEALLRSPSVTERSVSFTCQAPSLIEDYDSDQMTVPIRVMKSERKSPSLQEQNFLELLRSSDFRTPSPTKQTSPEDCANEYLCERDVMNAIESVDDENDVAELNSAAAVEEKKIPIDTSSIEREISAYLKEKHESTEDSPNRFQPSRQRPKTRSDNNQDGQYSVIVRNIESQTSREHKLIPLQNVGRSQSSAEKPVSDWTEITPYEADKESRLSRRHLSDLSFGVRERQKDMLPKELVPYDFPTDDEYSDPREPALQRFHENRWKRGIMAACRDVSECRKLVANLWKRRKSGTPIEAGLNGATDIYRVDSHRSQVRRNCPPELAVRFDSVLAQETVFRLLIRHCSDFGISVVARKPCYKLKVTVPISERDGPLLISIHLARQSQTKGTTVRLNRSREDHSGAPLGDIENTAKQLRSKLDENLEYIEESFTSHLLEDSGL